MTKLDHLVDDGMLKALARALVRKGKVEALVECLNGFMGEALLGYVVTCCGSGLNQYLAVRRPDPVANRFYWANFGYQAHLFEFQADAEEWALRVVAPSMMKEISVQAVKGQLHCGIAINECSDRKYDPVKSWVVEPDHRAGRTLA